MDRIGVWDYLIGAYMVSCLVAIVAYALQRVLDVVFWGWQHDSVTMFALMTLLGIWIFTLLGVWELWRTRRLTR